MRGSGYYPAGAEFDPRAPWNEPAHTYVECGACGGKGRHWHAYDLVDGEDIECTEETWTVLPETEDEAIAIRSRYIKGEVVVCEACDGEGEVEYIPDYDYGDYDDDY